MKEDIKNSEMEPHTILECYVYRAQNEPWRWFEYSIDHGKMVEVDPPTISDELKDEIESFCNLIKETDFWKEKCFASFIQLTCILEEEAVVSAKTSKNEFALGGKTDELQYYNWYKGHSIFKGKRLGDENDLESCPIESSLSIQKIVDSVEKSNLRNRIGGISFWKKDRELVIVEFLSL